MKLTRNYIINEISEAPIANENHIIRIKFEVRNKGTNNEYYAKPQVITTIFNFNVHKKI